MGACEASGLERSDSFSLHVGGGGGTRSDAPKAPESPMAPLRIQRSRFAVDRPGNIDEYYQMSHGRIGSGAFGQVTRAIHKDTGDVRAVKKISKAVASQLQNSQREVELLKGMDHPNIVRLYESYEDARQVYMVMEICEGGELFEKITASPQRCLNQLDAACAIQDILRAIAYIHGRDIVHRDVKPENVMLQYQAPVHKNVAKLIDFGTAKPCKKSQSLFTKVGTPYYVAPQVLDRHYGRECDLWSAGASLYLLLSGSPPFAGRSDSEILRQVRRARYSFERSCWNTISQEAKDLIRQLMHPDPTRRLSVEAALASPFLNTFANRRTSTNSEEKRPPVSVNEKRLTNFGMLCPLRKAALQVAAGFLNDAQVKLLRDEFVSLDKDGDGLISAEELKSCFAQAGNPKNSTDVHKLIAAVDTNQSGCIDYSEYVAASMDRESSLDRATCRRAFHVFDLDGNGIISVQDLTKLLAWKKHGIMRAQELLASMDHNGDGGVDFADFFDFLKYGDKH